MENPTRRRVLAAGLAGTALGLIGGRAASAGTDEPPATDPPQQPTSDDIERLAFAQSIELAARDLYAAAVEAGADDPLVRLLGENHQAYADVLAGILGVNASEGPDEALYDDLRSSFEVGDLTRLAGPAYDLESTLVATHTELLRLLEGIDGARLIASILIVEARQSTVLADAAGNGDDLDALFVNDAAPLAASRPIGG